MRYILDDRYKRSLPEWIMIVDYAEEHTVKQASRKYSGITPDGKEVRLSTEYIQQRIPEVKALWKELEYWFPHLLICSRKIMDVVYKDQELMQIYKKLEIDYDNNQRNEEEKQRSQKQLEKEKDTKEFYKYKYRQEIFIVRHYDPDIRIEQKRYGNKKRKADGKIQHRIEESELPPEIVEELRRSKVV